MKLFTDNPTCRLRQHCATCRDLDGGREWRKSLAAVFELPRDAPDFACPHGVAWGQSTRPPLPVVPDDEIKAILDAGDPGGCNC